MVWADMRVALGKPQVSPLRCEYYKYLSFDLATSICWALIYIQLHRRFFGPLLFLLSSLVASVVAKALPDIPYALSED